MDRIREYVRQRIDEARNRTTKGGGYSFTAKKGSEVSYTDARTGQKASGVYKKTVNRGGKSYIHVETGKEAVYVPVHQMHGAKKLDDLDESEGERQSLEEISSEVKKRYVRAAAKDLKNIGLVQGAHSQKNPTPNTREPDDFSKMNARMMRNREKGIERALKESDKMIDLEKRAKEGPKYKSGYGYDSDAHSAQQSPKMQTAINLHLRKGKSYHDAVEAAKKHVKD